MDPLFEVHRLNERGLANAAVIASEFDRLWNVIASGVPSSREISLARTHLEEACFYAKKAMASLKENQL